MKHWILTLIGATLIIGSTFITGVISYSLEREVSGINSEISQVNANFEKSESTYRHAIMLDNLANTQMTILRTSTPQNNDLLKHFERAYAAQTYSNILNLLISSGRDHDVIGNYGKEIKGLLDRINSGEESISKMENIKPELIQESGKYRGQLTLAKSSAAIKKNQIESRITIWRIAAVTIQLLGLVLMLIKEVPKNDKKVA